MKRTRVFWLLALAAFLAGCTGTSEPELPVLVAAADANGVHFLLARALNQGALEKAGSWAMPDVLDLAAGEKLYLLRRGKLERYRLADFREDAVPDPAAAREQSWALSGCDAGYLRLGARDLLAVCGPNAVYRLSDAAGTPEPPQKLDTAALAGFDALAFALYPDPAAGKDRLAFAYARPGGGWHLEVAGDDPTAPFFQEDLEAPTPTAIALRLAPDTGALGALAASEAKSALYAYRGGLKKVAEASRSLPGLTGDQGLWAAYGEGYLVVYGKAKQEASFPSFRAGWFHPNFYLYLASETGLRVLDVASLPSSYNAFIPLPGIHALTGFTLR